MGHLAICAEWVKEVCFTLCIDYEPELPQYPVQTITKYEPLRIYKLRSLTNYITKLVYKL